ncbi:MAG TPA: acyl-CoA dehydrogenase family protein [Thermoplasmata archaeon]|nr:acyl-CoA dehydrogenase family protein [Thermoplasmata archaeon]
MDAGTVDWRARAADFARDHVTPAAASMDRTDRFPTALRSALRDSGLMGLGLPPEWGGAGGRTRDLVAVLEELSAASAAVAVYLAVHLSVVATPILDRGTDAQRTRYLRPLATGGMLGAFALTEPGAGSDAASVACRAERTPGGYVLTGSKMFITNAAAADLVLLFATTDPALGRRGITGFLVRRDAAGYGIAQHLDKLGLRGSETNEIVLDHLEIGADDRLGPEGEGLPIALAALAGGRVGIAACALGVGRAALETMIEATRAEPADWKRAHVARAYAEISAARALVDRAALAKDDGRPFVELASAAKLFASSAAMRAAHAAFEVVGPAAARADATAGRILRDARVFPIVEGTTEIQELILGRALVGPG